MGSRILVEGCAPAQQRWVLQHPCVLSSCCGQLFLNHVFLFFCLFSFIFELFEFAFESAAFELSVGDGGNAGKTARSGVDSLTRIINHS